jgi:hypothetical protein
VPRIAEALLHEYRQVGVSTFSVSWTRAKSTFTLTCSIRIAQHIHNTAVRDHRRRDNSYRVHIGMYG